MKFNIWRIASIIIIFFLGLTIWHLLGLNETVRKNNLFLKEEKIGLEKKIADIYAEKNSLESQLSAFKREKEFLVVKINEYENRTNGLTGEIEELKGNLTALNESIFNKDAELDLLKKKIGEYEIANTALKRRIVSFAETPRASKGDAIELAPITVKSKGKKAKRKVRVLRVDRDYDFIVINAGRNHGIAKGDLLFVYRGKKMLGRIEVEKAASDVSIAKALCKSLKDAIRKGDKISY